MFPLKVLYLFTCEVFSLIEVQKFDCYQWLIVKDCKVVLALDFKSMDRKDKVEWREFYEGHLSFDDKEAELLLLGKAFKLVRENPDDIEKEILSLIDSSLDSVSINELMGFRLLKPADIRYFEKWVLDEEVIRYSMTKFHRISTFKEVEDWFRSTIFDSKTYQLGIIDNKSKELIGYAGIAGLNEVDGNGEYFIFIGNKDYWGKGIASLVTKEIVSRGFKELNLHRIFLTASSSNPGAVRAYEKAGFVHEGRMREAFYRNNAYSDKIIMGILKSEL